MDTILSSSNQSALFSKNIYLRIITNNKTDEKCRNVHVTVEFQTASSLQTEFVLKLTDEDDPFFLYELHLNLDDFKNLKREQGLLVDFNTFPQHVIDYLKLCIRDQHNDTTPANGSRFQLQLVTDEQQLTNHQTHLRVVEISSFKHLTHLSLLVTSANDYEIKNYLARRLQSKTMDYNQLSSDYEKLKRELELTQLELKEKNTNFEKLKLESDSNNNQIVGRHMQELAEEKERALQERTSLQEKMENDRRELEQTHLRNVRDMQKRLSELEETTKELTSLKYRNEITINELSSKLQTLTEEHQQTKDEIIKYRKTNTTLENDIHQYEKTVNHLRTKIALVEQEVKSKQEAIQQTNDRIAIEQESKKKYEETVQLKMEKMLELKRDLAKGNEIIVRFGNDLEKCKSDLQKYQQELAKSREKMKTKDQIATKQERILQEKERELATLQKENVELTNKIEKSNDSYQKLTEQHNEAKELLKKNEALINYLNHKLTELQNIQPQQVRLLNGNMTLDSSSSATTTTTNHFRPTSFLTNSQTNGELHSIRHVAQFPSLQTHYEPMNKTQGTTWNSSTTGHHQHMMSSTQMPVSSSTLNTSASAAVRHYSASNNDLKDNIEQYSLNPPVSSKIDPKYFQFSSTSGTAMTTGSQPLRSSMSAGNVQNSSRANTTTTNSLVTNKPLSTQQNRSIRQQSVNTTPLASAYSSEKQM
ncbi:unnamed protein product [Rotaria sp. Silwood2]|nr:unnamed protein product [Rotaria sp. Silwood2]CAF2659538.1 unnamed protein product [Rotaria sp. Silwood2]CAF2874707.1 unnamed protein product [Rotaria sp. Silwood2]CAF3939121.1 unnamed protein product [Rotaria sp. Silwood2]CAF3940457.1 unnamed protein product [Rotaria sp. Silwood2]